MLEPSRTARLDCLPPPARKRPGGWRAHSGLRALGIRRARAPAARSRAPAASTTMAARPRPARAAGGRLAGGVGCGSGSKWDVQDSLPVVGVPLPAVHAMGDHPRIGASGGLAAPNENWISGRSTRGRRCAIFDHVIHAASKPWPGTGYHGTGSPRLTPGWAVKLAEWHATARPPWGAVELCAGTPRFSWRDLSA